MNFEAATPTDAGRPTRERIAARSEVATSTGSVVVPSQTRDVEERLIDAQPLHERGELPEDLEDLGGELSIPSVSRRDDDQLLAETLCRRRRLCRAHPVGAGLIGGAGDHAAAPGPTNGHRPTDQAGIAQSLRLDEEGVQIYVQDRLSPRPHTLKLPSTCRGAAALADRRLFALGGAGAAGVSSEVR
jgi:hypothetical protein